MTPSKAALDPAGVSVRDFFLLCTMGHSDDCESSRAMLSHTYDSQPSAMAEYASSGVALL